MDTDQTKCLESSSKLTNRLIYRDQRSSNIESFSHKEQDNLEGISETVKESYLKRLEMMKDIDKKVSTIDAERQQYLQAIKEALADLAKANGQPVKKEFQCLGETIQIVMTSDGEYQEFLHDQPINFLEWAIDQKNNQISA